MVGWLDSTVGALQSGYAPGGGASPFPDYVPPPSGEAIWDQIAQQEALDRAAADRRNAAGMARGPIINSGASLSAISEPAVSMALGGGMQSPANPQAPFGPVPPSLMMAKAETAPPDQPPPGQVPMPQPRPPGADAPPATDMSSQARGADVASRGMAGAPMSIAGPQPQAPVEAPSFMDRARGFAPALIAAGAALQGDNSVASNMIKQRDALALQAQQGNATAQLLASRGAKPAEIRAAISGGPDAVKALLAEYLGKDKWKVVQVGEDQYGGKKFMQQNETDGTLRDLKTADGKVPAEVVDGAAPGLSDAQKNRVQAIIEGREPYPAMSRARDAQMIRDAVHAADPQFDAVNYNARLKARQSFTSGKDRDNLKSFNTTIGHLEELDKAVGDLHNSNFPAWNKYVANPVAEQFDPKYQASLKRFQAARTAVSDELTRAFRGSGGNVHDIIQWENAINSADSPEALRSAIRTAANLLESRISSVGDSYNAAMGTTKDPLELLTPHAREAFEQLKAGARGGAAPAGALKPGAYRYDPETGRLVPK